MTYETTVEPVTTFVLASHGPIEWAAVRRAKLVALGCSQAYADAIAIRIGTAKVATS